MIVLGYAIQWIVCGILGFAGGYAWRRDRAVSVVCLVGVVLVVLLGFVLRSV